MKTLLLIAPLIVLLTITLNAQQNINPLSLEVDMQTDSITKAELLDTIAQSLNIHFSYNPELIGAHDSVKINSRDQNLLSVLMQIADPEMVGFHVLDNQIIFYPLKNETSTNKEENKIDPYLIIRGSVSERNEDVPIPFCNIAILRKGLGTMSNNNGNFIIKIPTSFCNDTLRFSCLGYIPFDIPISLTVDTILNIKLEKTFFNIKTVDVVHYQPALLLQKYFDNLDANYDNEYTLLTTFYREIILENEDYTDVSEAVLNVLKAPYSNDVREDLVKFIKGRKSSNVQPFDDIKFKLKGGPYYITKLDVVKNRESFINPDFINLFHYEFEKKSLINGRDIAIISFTPVYNLRELLFEGLLYFDIETGAIARVEFNYTKAGLKEARKLMIEKEPRDCKAIPTDLSYKVDYNYIDGKWYLLSANSSMQIKIINREKKQKTNFHSTSEILITNIEKGDLQHFSRKDIFKPSEFFTEKITTYDKTFWENYNVIEPEQEMEKAIRNFDDHKQIITDKRN